MTESPLVSESTIMCRVLELASRVAPSEATVLITGESGTGKERVARFIHEQSPRAEGPFLAVNCGALPETLLESELFGHRKGAFTGAGSNAVGLFEAAKNGTLFLDEIGETSQLLQVRLLRALQERTVRPVGATRDVPVNVRIIAATNRDLVAMVRSGQFRKDLYYRLRVVPLELPPLRARRADLMPLAQEFIAKTCKDNCCGPCSLSVESLEALSRYSWPGNIRELENAIERAVVLARERPHIELEDLPPEILGHDVGLTGLEPLADLDGELLPLHEVEKRHIIEALRRCGGNRKQTAKALQIGENTLWRRLKSYGLVQQRETAEEP